MANERRLIDANALSGQMQEKADRMFTQGRYTPAQDYMFVATVVDNAPTVDAVEVVRCEECKYREDCIKQIEFMGRDLVLELNTHEYRPLKFCSYGAKSGTQPQREDV